MIAQNRPVTPQDLMNASAGLYLLEHLGAPESAIKEWLKRHPRYLEPLPDITRSWGSRYFDQTFIIK